MIKPRTMISIAAFSLLLITMAACGGDTASNPLPTGTPNLAMAQPSDTALAIATSTSTDLQAAATVTVVPATDTAALPTMTDSPVIGTATPMSAMPTPTPNYPPEAAAAVAAAKEQLGKMVGIPADQVSVVSVTSQVWTDSGLGCPASMGMAKLNIPGYLIILKIKNAIFEYHTNQDASIVRPCTNGTGSNGSGAGMASPTIEAGSTGGNTVQDQTTEAAKQDLATRLGVGEATISVKSVTATMWRDSGLGCGKGIYLQVITPGYLIVLTASGSDYQYHTDMKSMLVLCVNGAPAK